MAVFFVLCRVCVRAVSIGGWGVSPNREISMAPVSVMPRLGFWSSISPPRAPGAAVVFFPFSLPCRYVQGF